MFEEFYGFREKPFQLAPNADYLYKSIKHRNALSYLEYGLTENVGIIVLTGEVGSGKTTLIQYILKKLGKEFETAFISNTNITAGQLLRMVQSEFEIPREDGDKAAVIEALNRYFIDQYEQDRRPLLVIDEAQNLSAHALEEVRMLSNLQGKHRALVQIFLIGQPELLQTLKRADMAQFTQRVAVHFHLTSLDEEETAEYIAHRLRIAGGREDLFTPEAVHMVYEIARGVPRSINLICQAALVYGFADETESIGADLIRQITDDQIGVGIRSEGAEEKHEGASPSRKYAGGRARAAVAEEVENIRMECKGRIQQLEEDAKKGHQVLVAQLQNALEEERKRYDALSLKMTARNEALAVRFATLERKHAMLVQHLNEMEQKLKDLSLKPAAEDGKEPTHEILDKHGGVLRNRAAS